MDFTLRVIKVYWRKFSKGMRYMTYTLNAILGTVESGRIVTSLCNRLAQMLVVCTGLRQRRQQEDLTFHLYFGESTKGLFLD